MRSRHLNQWLTAARALANSLDGTLYDTTNSVLTNQTIGHMREEVIALQAGIPVCLGNDGFTQDMWTEWKTAYLLHKLHHRDPRRMNGMHIIQMAVSNNSALAGTFFPSAPSRPNKSRRPCRSNLRRLPPTHPAHPWKSPLAYPLRLP